MRNSSLIGHVVDAFDLIHSRNNPADETLHSFFRDRRYLGSNDRRFIADATYGMIREERSLRYISEHALSSMNRSSQQLPVPSILLYLSFAARILSQPPSEVLGDVQDLREYGKQPALNTEEFLAAVTSVASPLSGIEDPVARLAIAYSMPDFAITEWIARYGAEECRELCAALNTPAPPAVRANLICGSVSACRSALAAEGVPTVEGRISPEALILPKRLTLQSLKSFRDGLFEMQDEGSQLISHLVSPLPGETVLDACAGGGGKSLHMAALMENRGTIFASDIDHRRLRQAVLRAGRARVKIMKPLETGSVRPPGGCDRVLVDAPCSGSGTWRRNPWAKRLTTSQMVADYSARQRTILQDSSTSVRDGGRLVYATCSLFTGENENIVEWFLERNPDFRLINATESLRLRGIDTIGSGAFLSLAPHRNGTDGFFAAAMERLR